MRAVSPLVEVLRYGTARELPEDALRGLVESLVVEVCTGFAAACRRLDADVAAELVPVVRGYDRSVGLLDVPALLTLWHRSLAALAADDDAAAGLRGLAQRILYDCGAASPEDTELAFSRSLSRAVPAAPAGAWLEGFLEGAGDVLLHDPQLLRCVDTWIDGQRKEDFQELLPLLRRAFSGFDASLRQRLMGALGKLTTGAGTTPAAASPSSLDPGAEQAFARAWPLIETILGLDERKETPP